MQGLVLTCMAWTDVHGLDLHGLDLHGLDLHGLDLHGLDLHGPVLHGLVIPSWYTWSMLPWVHPPLHRCTRTEAAWSPYTTVAIDIVLLTVTGLPFTVLPS